MNTESTPKRVEVKNSLRHAFIDLTPINENEKVSKKKYLCKRGNRETENNGTDSEIDAEPVIRSQVHRSCKKRKSKENEKIKPYRYSAKNVSPNTSDDLIGDDDENLYVSVKSQKNNSKIQFLDSKIDELLIGATCNLEKNGEAIKLNNSKESNSKYLKDEFSSESLSVSDVMKWSDTSLVPVENESYFCNLFKKKLFHNASKKDIIKSQTSGWTQCDLKEFSYNDYNCHVSDESFYGLPLKVQQLYQQRGIQKLFTWQENCLNLDAVKGKKNLVYSLPTSGGKSLVAEILILREILVHHKNVLFILPFVSIVQEKIQDFSPFALEFNFSLEEYAGGKGVIPPKKHRKKNSLMIATIEKGLIIVNSLIESKRLGELGLVVVDELHMLLEEGRGSNLEILLIQILHCSRGEIQIIGMSATIGNLEELASFMQAESYCGDFRPVQVSEFIKCENKIYSIDFSLEELFKETRILDSSHEEDCDGIAELVREVVPGESVIIFCATKKNCENVAALLSDVLSKSPNSDFAKFKEAERTCLHEALFNEMNEKVCPVLRRTLPFGVAYHHSGLTVGERKLLEEGFRQGTLSVICCTSTLAVGVNLPAKRVILRSPFVGKDFISLSKYKQMVGRAGRTGFGCEGDSFLICQPKDLERAKTLFRSHMDKVISRMDVDNCKNLILSSISLGTATTKKDLKELMKCSLLHSQRLKLNEDTGEIVDDCIRNLFKQGALAVKRKSEESAISVEGKEGKCPGITNSCQLAVSKLGRAAVKGGFNLEEAHELYRVLRKAQESLVLLTNLHLLYLVTPHDFISQIKPNFSILFNIYMDLNEKDVRVAEAIGITECVVSKLVVGSKPKNVKDAVLTRFYISLILYELWNQNSIWDVAQLFQLPRGLVQTLMTSAATFVNSILRFCEEFEEFWSFKCLFTDFAPRLAHCCAPELLPLMDLPAVKRGRAKQLYDAGYKTIEKVALARPSDLVRALKYIPFGAASNIVAAAKLMLVEKAENLREEADMVLEALTEKMAEEEEIDRK